MADLLMIHPGLEPQAVRRFAREQWPDGDLRRPPAGYREVSSAFFGLRVFCHESRLKGPLQADPELPARVRAWVDALALGWGFEKVFRARELNFWTFLRDRMIRWLSELMTERALIEAIAGDDRLSIVAVGVDGYRRMMLRSLAELLQGRIRPETAFLDPPRVAPRETATERRLRRIFFLLQDAWHGVQLLFEDIFVRRPKVLLVSDSRCWQRRAGKEGDWTRTDVHCEGIWNEGRHRPLRLYYRTESYHPDIGAMTGGRLAPTYLRHFLFLLGQGSRGFWEVRRIRRQWNRLKVRDEFRQALSFEGLRLAEIIIAWLDEATGQRLPAYVRATRRETHFLRGLRPDVLLLTREQEGNRPILVTARQLGIPTLALQLRPFHDRDHAYVLPSRAPDRVGGQADRLCVFGASTKAFLVETGALDPSSIVVSGDPRLDAGDPAADLDPDVLLRLRRRWGVEEGQRVIAVACEPQECPELLAWLAAWVSGRSDAFVLIRPQYDQQSATTAERRLASAPGLRWCHLDTQEAVAEWLAGVDLLLTTSQLAVAEAILRRTPSVLVSLGNSPRAAGPDPDGLVRQAASAEELRAVLQDVLDSPPARLPADEHWREYAAEAFGWGRGGASARVLDAAEQMIRKR